MIKHATGHGRHPPGKNANAIKKSIVTIICFGCWWPRRLTNVLRRMPGALFAMFRAISWTTCKLQLWSLCNGCLAARHCFSDRNALPEGVHRNTRGVVLFDTDVPRPEAGIGTPSAPMYKSCQEAGSE